MSIIKADFVVPLKTPAKFRSLEFNTATPEVYDKVAESQLAIPKLLSPIDQLKGPVTLLEDGPLEEVVEFPFVVFVDVELLLEAISPSINFVLFYICINNICRNVTSYMMIFVRSMPMNTISMPMHS